MTFRIRHAFLIPLGLLCLEVLALLASCLWFDEPLAKSLILGFMILPVLVLFAESLLRQARFDDETIEVRKLLRRKRLRFADITAVESILVKKRAFITLCAGDDDYLILSNAYADFPRLVRLLLARVPASSISAEATALAADPPSKSSDIVSCWLAALLLGFILYAQLKSHLGAALPL
ncbi:hypothetical protein [Desulfuromonas thiophila]|uniref:hypothetical protein n=1 Tax=Desulfuromonas thiophila TaxID=57664 RepID=UPI0024A7E073|nr:hypothetical protein [Desulfuromonas thiophila]